MYLNFSFLNLVPAIFVVLAGLYFRSRQTDENMSHRWMLFLFLIVAVLFANQFLGLQWEVFRLGALLQPTLFGVTVALIVHLAESRQLWSRNTLWLTLLIALVTLATLVYWSFRSDPILLLTSVITVLAWKSWEWRGWLRWLAWVVLLLLLLSVIFYSVNPYPMLLNGARWAQELIFLGSLLVYPVTAVGLAGRLVYSSLISDPLPRWPVTILHLALGMLLLLLLSTLVVTETVWVQAEDSITIQHIIIFLAAIAVGMLMAWGLSGWRRLGSLVFVLVVTLTAYFADQQGWRLTPTSVTEARAEKIERAIQRYYEHQGTYPASLSELAPSYLLLISQPMIYRDQTWCYEGGADYYRLGYVHQPAYGVPDEYITIRIPASAGRPPNPGWSCDQVLERVKSKAP